MLKKVILLATAAVMAVSAFAQPADNEQPRQKPSKGKILLVVTNHGRMGDLDKPTGFWLAEVSHAWTKFIDAGYEVVFASPRGGVAPVDPRSHKLDDPDNKRMWSKRDVVESLANTTPLAEVKPGNFEAIFFAGGHGTMWDFPQSQPLQDVTQKMWEQGKVVSAVCHGPAALVNVKTADGKLLVDGKKVAAFTNSEEKAAGLDEVVPFLLETRLEEQGADVQTAPNYQEKVVVDGKLITGQNPASAAGVAEEVLKALGANPDGKDKQADNATDKRPRKQRRANRASAQ